MSSTLPTSARRSVLQGAVEFWSDLREGLWFVKRGAINWTVWNFEKHPWAVSVMFDDMSLFPHVRNAFRDGTITFEAFVRSAGSFEDVFEFDDELQEQIIDDMSVVIQRLLDERGSDGRPLLMNVDRSSARVIEAHDLNKKVQGIVLTFNATF